MKEHRLAWYTGPALFLLSASLLAFEIVLLRIFSIESYHHFAFMAVGVALLGFGASGTVLILLHRFTRGREESLFAALATLTPPVLLIAPALARIPHFDPTQLVWDGSQWWGLTAVYAALALPFLLGAGAVAVALEEGGNRVGRLYAWNLAGSGAGAAGALLLLFLFRPDGALAWTAVPAAAGAVGILLTRRHWTGRTVAILLALLTCWMVARPPTPLQVIHFKGLPQVEAYPNARRLGEAASPTGWVVAVDAPAFRHAPGLSLAYRGEIPQQVSLLVDGEVAGAAFREEDEAPEMDFLDWLPSSAAYATGSPESVLILGAGTGSGVTNALRHGASRVTAVELVEPLARFHETVAPDAASPYRDPAVSLVVGDARSFAARTEARFSRVILPVSGVFNATAAGIHSGGEDFLNTVQAYRSYLRLLEPGGIFAATRWLRVPPRDNVRSILTAAEALRAPGRVTVSESLAFVRSWATGTLLVKPDGFSQAEIESLRAFCESRFFDLDWPVPGGPFEGTFNQLDRPVYREAVAAASLGPDSAGAFARTYPFDVRPTGDDRPYFGRFLRPASIPSLLRGNPGEWVPYAEWGYLATLATFVQSGLLALLLMGLPALFLGRSAGRKKRSFGKSAVYFGGIGVGFILVEMMAIQQLSLVLGHPVYAASGTLGLLLVSSGFGSWLSDRLPALGARRACWAVAVAAVALAALTPTLSLMASLPLPVRAGMTLGVVGLAGCFMGMPFPLGLRRMVREDGGVAWAWAANGVASVLGASLAVLLAMEVGTRVVLLFAASSYLVAGGVAGRRSSAP